MNGHLFVIVEFPMADTPLAKLTARHPGSTVDLISEPAVDIEGDRLHPSLVLIKGLATTELNYALAQLEKAYDHLEPLERDDLRNHWLGRVRIRESVYSKNAGAAVMAQFQHRFGAPWAHIDEGQIYLRGKVNDPAHGDLLVDQMKRYFAKAKVEAQVEVREISPKDYGVWEELVQRSIGLSP